MKQTTVIWRGLSLLFGLVLIIAAIAVKPSSVQAASAGDIIINEIMYNPQSGVDADEFLELYNTTASAINLQGWCFTQGITLCFSSPMTLNAHSYGVVSPDAARTTSTYGVTSIGTYTGKLDNGGEQVTLADGPLPSGNIINSVGYDDVPPWPTSPDGSGPSLELKHPTLNNSLSTSWGASLNGPTPGVQNSLFGINLPAITNVTTPTGVNENEAVTITANITNATNVSLVHKYITNNGSNAIATETMHDDGSSNDGAAGDGVYGATIPGRAASAVIQYRVEAQNVDGTATVPSADDSQNYLGYAILDNTISTNAEILNLFVTTADWQDLHTNHIDDNVYVPSVLVYDGKVYDNTQVRIKGEYSRTFDKKSYKIKLPRGYKIDMAGGSGRQVNEFHLNGDYKSQTMAISATAWWLADQAGLPTPDYIPVRLQHNGQFEGLYHFAEKYESEWRQEKGYNTGELYEDFNEIQSGADDLSRIEDWRANMLIDNEDPAKRGYMLDVLDIPNIITYMSIQGMADSWDHYAYGTNTYSYYNDKNGRWSQLYWDFDSAWNTAGESSPTYVSPYDFFNDYAPMAELRFPEASVYYQKDFRAMYMRRLRTLVDKVYATNQLYDYFTNYADRYSSDAALDLAKWPNIDSSRSDRNGEEQRIKFTSKLLQTYFAQGWALPQSQQTADKSMVAIDSAVADLSNDQEYIKLANNSGQYVDISGWRFEEINYTIPAGTVIPAGGSVYFVRDDIGYKAAHSPAFIAGRFTNDLDTNVSQVVTLKTDDGATIGSYAY